MTVAHTYSSGGYSMSLQGASARGIGRVGGWAGLREDSPDRGGLRKRPRHNRIEWARDATASLRFGLKNVVPTMLRT